MRQDTFPNEIRAFTEAVDQVLNSNTVLIRRELPLHREFDVVAYIAEAFGSGDFHAWFQEALGDSGTERQRLNRSFVLLRFSFAEFRRMLGDMLSEKRSPYRVDLPRNQRKFLADDFIEATINAHHERSYLQRAEEIDASWNFYAMPRSIDHIDEHEIDHPESGEMILKTGPDAEPGNYLERYFYGLGGDAFLIFHNDRTLFFLLANGSD